MSKTGASPAALPGVSSPKGLFSRMGSLVSATLRVGRTFPSFADPRPEPQRGPLGRIGSLEVRIARSPAEIRAAQELRYRVFYEEMGALADRRTSAARRDSDRFDPICDHLLVVDHGAAGARRFRRPAARIVGTYRLLRQEVAEANGGFYTAGEFDIAPVLARHHGLRFLELGRSCVLPGYRDKRTMELLWHGIWAYVLDAGVDVMFGCASFEGTDPRQLATPLSFLHHYARSPEEWRVRPAPGRGTRMDLLGRDEVDARTALRTLPPLVKGYLRLGATVGEGAVVDRQFGTTDVLIMLPVAGISSRYVSYYGADAGRHALPA